MMARIEQSVEVNAPVRTVYNQLIQFEQYPRFMDDVKQVRQLDDTHLHWRAGSSNLDMEWDTEFTQQVPNQCITWRTTSKPHYAGRIELQSLAQDRTRIDVSIDCEQGQQILAQHGDAHSAVAQRIEHSLARLKKLVEGSQNKGNAAQAADARRPEQAHAEERSWIPNFMQIWDEPLGMMRKMSEEMDQIVGKFVGHSTQQHSKARGTSGEWTPAVEVAQSEDKLVICAELPGVRCDEVRVEIKNDRVTIEGDRHPAQQAQELQRSERNYGHFYRVISLPEGAEPDTASAALHDGVLEITVPVPNGGRRARRIDIRTQ